MSQYIRYQPLALGGGGGGGTTLVMGALDGTTPSADGAVIAAGSLYMQSASGTLPGLVNTTTQSFAGNKTFLGNLIFNGSITGDLSNGTVLATGSSTTRKLNARFAEVVDVMDFGAVGDGTTDDTAAIQAAVTYALTLSPVGQVFLPKRHLVTSSINVNRAVDTTTSEFRIFGTGSGSGFLVTSTSSFSIIDSTYVVTTRPLSEFVTFENLEFYASSPTTVVADVISNKFLRVKFLNCYFYQIRCTYASVYAQTFQFQSCNIRKAPGDGSTTGKAYWFDAIDSWDVSFESCIFEDTNHYLIRTSSSAGTSGAKGFRFINNLAENSDLVLSITDPSSAFIAGNYFEGNTVGDIVINTHNGSNSVAIHSNYFSGGTLGGKHLIDYAGAITAVSSIGNTIAQGTDPVANILHYNIANVTNFVTNGDSAINQLISPFTAPSIFNGTALNTRIGTFEVNSDTLITRNVDTASANSLVLKTNGSAALTLNTDLNAQFAGTVGIGGAPSTAVQLQATNPTVLTGTGSNSAAGFTITGVGTLFFTQMRIGDQITIGGETNVVNGITSDTSLTIVGTITGANSGAPMIRTPMTPIGMYYYPNSTLQLGGTRSTIQLGTTGTNFFYVVGDAASAGSTSTGSSGMSVVNYAGGGTASQSLISLVKSRGNEAAPAVVQTSDTLGVINWRGYNGVGISNTSAQIGALATETYSSTARGASLIFKTTPNTTNTLTTVLTLSQNGTAAFTGNVSAPNISGTNTGDVTLGTANGLSLVGQALSLAAADTGTTGALTSTDWNTFNGKQTNVITTLGDLVYGGAAGAITRLAGNTALNPAILSQQGTGAVSAAPAWIATTGSGSVVRSASPAFSGTITGTGTFSGAWIFGSPFTLTGAAASTDFVVRRSNNTTASPTALALNDIISKVGARGYGTSGFIATNATSIESVATQAFTNANGGAKLNFYTTPNSTIVPALALTLDQDQSMTAAGAVVMNKTVGIIATPGTSDQVAVNGTTTLTGVTQRAFAATMTGTSASTTGMTGFHSQLTTAASTTVGLVANFRSASTTVGSSGTMTRFTGFHDSGAQQHFGTNNAAFADNASYTGNWFINNSIADPSILTGAVTLSNLAGTGSRAVLADSVGLLSAPVSDSRLKTNVAPIESQVDPIDAVKRLTGVFFNWDTSIERVKNHGPQQEIGMIAQDVEKVIPQAVREDKDGWKSLDYSHLVPLLIEAIKKQQTQIDALQALLSGKGAP